MRRTAPKNALYAQSGGVSAVINATAAGVIETAARHRRHIGKVFAGRHGIVGALEEDLIDVSRESRATIRGLRHTPGRRLRLGALQAQGHRPEPRRIRAPDRGVPRPRHRLLLLQRRQRLDGHRPQALADRPQLGYPITCIGVPKTVDNDLPVTDTCPGFGSVAKYVAVSTREAALDVASMARPRPRCS
jgi:ATP-dependent phosphofructokinase / diphosphate-dependent phosphofructokinase